MSVATASGTLSVEVHVDPRLLPEQLHTTTVSSSSTKPATSSSASSSSFTPPSSRSKTASFVVPLPVTVYAPVCELKRHIAHRTGIPPHLQRLSLLGSTDNFRFPSSVLLTKRSRHESYSVTVSTYCETDPSQRWTLAVDPTDTVLDLKFLLQPLVKADPDYQRLYVWRKGDRGRAEVSDASSLMQAGVHAGSALRLLFEYPSSTSGHGTIHRMLPHLVRYFDPAVTTIGHLFRWSVSKHAGQPFFGTREWKPDGTRGAYTWQTYGEVGKRVTAFGSGLVSLGLKRGDCVGVMSANRSEWLLTDMSCAVQSLVTVPLYDTLGPDAVRYIINHSQAKAVVVARAQLKHVAACHSACPTLQLVILMDDDSPDKQFAASGATGFTHTVSAVERLGASQPAADRLPGPDEVYTLCYTSGTTGQPKGAILKHSNMIAAVAGADVFLTPELLQEGSQVVFSYLPMAHIYERQVDMSSIARGRALGFSQGDHSKLADDVAELKPNVFPGVPRVWQRMYDRITTQVASANFISRQLFHRALAAKTDALAHGVHDATLWDRLVFHNIAAKFGGQLRLLISGAAPISPTVAEFIHIAFQAPMLEGYGLTETCATLTLQPLESLNYGRAVGVPMPCNEVKLVDVVDMGYLSTDQPQPRGEVWVRGFNVFAGYYKLPDVTADCLTADGWFQTGDIGTWLADGSLKIIDRKKNLFKLSQGEYIRPEHIEGVYKQCKLISNIYVHGDSTQNFLVALVVPNLEALGMTARSKTDLANDRKLEQQILHSMDELARQEGLNGFEQVKRIRLLEDDFTVDNGLLTPTLKIKRHQVAKQYEKEIRELYSTADLKPETPRAKL